MQSDALRAVADVEETLEDDGIGVVETRNVRSTVDGDVAHATVVLEVPIDRRGEGETDESDVPDETEGNEAGTTCDECGYTAASERGLTIHETKVHGEHDDVWCGICGAGPFEGSAPLAGHHTGSGHEGDTQPVETPPAESESGVAETAPNTETQVAQTDPTGGAGDHDDHRDDQEYGDVDDEDLLEEFDEDDLVEALEGAQSLHHLSRDLGVGRERAREVAGELGLLEDLASGMPQLTRDEAEQAVQEVRS